MRIHLCTARGLPHISWSPCYLLCLCLQIDDSGYISLLDVNSSNASNLPLSTPYAPRDFPLTSSNTIISGIDWSAVVAPYWYDVDTRGSGSGRIYYKNVTKDTDTDLIVQIDSLATSHLCGFATIWALIVTWDEVGYYNSQAGAVSYDGYLPYHSS